MSAVMSNLSRVTEDLTALVQGLANAAGEEAAQMIDQTLTPEVMRDFNLTVEAMRNLLWLYILAASRATGGDVNHSSQGERLQRATEVLRSLREDSVPLSWRVPEGSSFVEQVEALTNYYSQKAAIAGQAGKRPLISPENSAAALPAA